MSNFLFLQQAYRNSWQQYLNALEADAEAGWDLCVLTASNEQQANIYRRQLDWRRAAGLLPPATEFHVLADPAGTRIGSGAATLRVLAALRALGMDLAERRVLLIHSGGDSRRLPHCSAQGKLFARVPRTLPDGRASTVFDEFLITLSGVPNHKPAGLLIAAGDVLLVFDPLQLTLQRPGVTGVAAAAPVALGRRHGVYVESTEGATVGAYLHKAGEAALAAAGAISPDGQVAIDTGLVWLDAATVGAWLGLLDHAPVAHLCRLGAGEGPAAGQLNLYGDLLLPLSSATRHEAYLADTSDGPATPDVQAARKAIWTQTRQLPFHMERLQPALFVHFGTTAEYWQTIAADAALRRTCGWRLHAASWPAPPAEEELSQLALIAAQVDGAAQGNGQPALVVDSLLRGGLRWQGSALVANVVSETPVELGADCALHQLPVPGGWVTRLFGVHDDPKRTVDAGGTFLNRPWRAWLDETGFDEATLWPGVAPEARCLWNARLYPVASARDASLALAMPLMHAEARRGGWQESWLNAERLTLEDAFLRADGERLLADVEAVEDAVAVQRFCAAVAAETPAREALRELGAGKALRQRRSPAAERWVVRSDPLVRLRGYQALRVATGRRAHETQAFATLASLIAGGAVPSRTAQTPHWQHAQARVDAAARVDFGGGWTDTPPYSIERGGSVLNAAITLDGRHPLTAEAVLLEEPRLLLESADVNMALAPQRVGEVLAYKNPGDPFALHKAALVLRGVVAHDEDPDRPLAELLAARGAGLRLRTQTSIPRGSGLGVSSILAGAVLLSLAHLAGETLPQGTLFDEVLALEQMMTTGGGWQDQAGGLTGGVKLITSAPGLPQRLQVEPLRLSPATQQALAERLVVVYTGQQRLAKNLLQAIVGRWIAREPEMQQILGELAALAQAMRAVLEAGQVTTFGTLLGVHWSLNKRMDPGCSNPFIDSLFETVQPFVDGGKLAGAGGGGFAFFVAKEAGAMRKLEAALANRFAGTRVGVWPSALAADGYQLAVV